MSLHIEQLSKIPKFEICFEEHFTETDLEFASVITAENRLNPSALIPRSDYCDLTQGNSKGKKNKLNF